MIRVVLPHHLQTLARCGREVSLELAGDVSQATLLDALESKYPMLRGTIRDHESLQRRPRVRFFADGRDISHEPPDARLPDSVQRGQEPFRIVGAVAGG